MWSTTVTVLAHQGGWDEMLMVLTPVAVFGLLLWLANSRANRARDERTATAPGDQTSPDDQPLRDGPAGDGATLD